MSAAIQRMDERMNAIAAAATTHFTTRVVKRSLFQHFDQHLPGELEKGVVMLISAGEGDYKRDFGMVAKDGTHRLLMIGHMIVGEDTEPVAVEQAEMVLIEEIKAFCVSTQIQGLSLNIVESEHSRQTAHPYGWVVVQLEAGPPFQTTY